MEKCYSTNDEDFHDLDYVLDLLSEDHKVGEVVEITEGEQKPFLHSDFINPEHIAELIQEQAFDEISEWDQDYLYDFLKDEKLTKDLRSLLINFFNKHAEQPRCFKVINTKKISVTLGD